MVRGSLTCDLHGGLGCVDSTCPTLVGSPVCEKSRAFRTAGGVIHSYAGVADSDRVVLTVDG